MKKLLFSFALLGLSLASAKNFEVTIHNPAAIGGSRIQAGEYKLEIKGDRVLLKAGKMVDEFPVQVQNEARKFENTTVTYAEEGGTSRIQEIHIGGTNIKLLFNN